MVSILALCFVVIGIMSLFVKTSGEVSYTINDKTHEYKWDHINET